MGLHEQAIAEARRAMQLDPFSRFIYGDLSWVLLMARRYEQALVESQTVVERQPDFGYARAVLALSYAENGRYAEAVTEAQTATRLDDSPFILASLVQMHALARNRSEAMKGLQNLEQLSRKRYVCSYEVATGYVLLREKEQAFPWFDKAVEERSDCMVMLAVDPPDRQPAFRPTLSGPPAPRRPAAVTAIFPALRALWKYSRDAFYAHPRAPKSAIVDESARHVGGQCPVTGNTEVIHMDD
jgi:tetratricopeptide (TPR) repeat protein